MNVTVTLFGPLRDNLPYDADGNRVAIELEPGATVQDAATALGIPARQIFAVLVDGEQTDRSTRLAEGVEVTLMPPYSGGAT
ncbi:MAG TPA: MoaD/ThiS family protein [Actinomycetota bacterium]|nr:MoaD/ThiS family protein [Actinomycetota bacterium]